MTLVHTFNDNRKQLKIERGDGLYLFCSDGTKYFDASSGITGHSILCYRNKTVINAVNRQLNKIPHLDFKYFSDGLREELAEILCSAGDCNLKAFYPVGHSGGEACEAAIKLSYLSHVANGEPNKTRVIYRAQGYHGSTSDSLSIGDRPNLEIFRTFHPKNREKISEHNFIRHGQTDETIEEYGARSALELEKKILELGPENVASFVGETMLGGLVGDVPAAPNYWTEVRKICDRHRVHLILDEVWCGTGTSGKFFCADWDNVTPDFLFMGKTLAAGYGAVSGILLKTERLKEIRSKYPSIPHSITHQGFSMGIAAAIATQKIILSKGFIDQVNRKGKILRKQLSKNLSCSKFLLDIRGRGLRNSLEYKCDQQHLFGITVAEVLKERHKIIISGKWHRLSFSPALTISDNDILFLADTFSDVFLEVERRWNDWDKTNIDSKSFF